MSISSVGGFDPIQHVAWGAATARTHTDRFSNLLAEANPSTAGTDESTPVQTKMTEPIRPHVLAPNDPLNQYLKPSDRAAFVSYYGVDIRPSGDVMTPLDRGPNEVQAVLSAAGQIASARANGTVTDADVTEDYIRDLVQGFRDRIDQNLPPFEDDLHKDHLDVTT